MELFPAIDIRHGRVVRLTRGEADAETAYHSDPVAQAERFTWQGARWIHLVDLDRAFGDGDNSAVIDRIATRVGSHVQIQLGGGIRSLEDVRRLGDTAVTRLVLGTAAVEDPALVPAAVEALGPARVGVGIDVRDGQVSTRGWTRSSGRAAADLVHEVAGHGVRTVIYTDIARDGMLSGPDVQGALALQEGSGVGIILSGGVGTLDDLRAVQGSGLAGVIVGRALYEQRFTLPEALAVLA